MKLHKAKRFNTIESYGICTCMHFTCACTCNCRCSPGGLPSGTVAEADNNISRVRTRDNMNEHSQQNLSL